MWEKVDKIVGRKLKEWERWLWLFWMINCYNDDVVDLSLMKKIGIENWKKGEIWASHLRRWGFLKRVGRGVYIFNRLGLKYLENTFGREIILGKKAYYKALLKEGGVE